MATVKVPEKALHLSQDLEVTFSEEDKWKASMLGYSGEPMSHPFFGDLIVDVAGIEFRHERIPILEDHDDEKKIGFSAKPDTTDNKVYFNDITLLDNYFASEFRQNSKKGFPYQASISFYPQKIEELGEKAEADVNGYTVTGPALIFRESIFRESSVVTFGMDHRTSSVAQSNEDVVLNLSEADASVISRFITKEKEETNMSTEEMETQIQEYKNQLDDYAKKIADLTAANVKKDLEAEIGEDDANFLMEFHSNLGTEALTKIAKKFADYQKKIEELGAPQGEEGNSNKPNEITVADIQKYAAENNVSFLDAQKQLYTKE